MYFEDLTAYCYYLPFNLSDVRNVGWLDTSHAYSKGETSGSFLSKLRQSICARQSNVDAHVNVIRGVHSCNICGGPRIEIDCQNSKVLLGMSEIWLPASRGYFASPSMTLHYIEVHGYVPPQEYVDAVMALDLSQSFNAQEIYDNLVSKQG